jgi:hypothetical protein
MTGRQSGTLTYRAMDKDLSLFNPPDDILEFYRDYGEDYTEWFEHADDLFEYIDKHYPLVSAHRTAKQKYSSLIPASVSPFNLYFTKKNLSKLNLDIDNPYRLNSAGLRCDELRVDRDGLDILFAGCSITFGDGMLEEYIWPKIVYDELSKKYNTSGYYNVAGPGLNHFEIYHQIFKYIEIYGNPNFIFINFPDLNRAVDSGVEVHALFPTIIPMHNALLQYAKANGIKLVMFSWDIHSFSDGPYPNTEPNDNDHFVKTPHLDPRKIINKTLFQFSSSDRNEFMMNYMSINKKHTLKNFMLRGLDVVHPGVAEHAFYADFALSAFKELSDV